jgi:hypothetical protein
MASTQLTKPTITSTGTGSSGSIGNDASGSGDASFQNPTSAASTAATSYQDGEHVDRTPQFTFYHDGKMYCIWMELDVDSYSQVQELPDSRYREWIEEQKTSGLVNNGVSPIVDDGSERYLLLAECSEDSVQSPSINQPSCSRNVQRRIGRGPAEQRPLSGGQNTYWYRSGCRGFRVGCLDWSGVCHRSPIQEDVCKCPATARRTEDGRRYRAWAIKRAIGCLDCPRNNLTLHSSHKLTSGQAQDLTLLQTQLME